MNKKTLIRNTIEALNRLPIDKVDEVRAFAEYLLSKLDDKIISEGAQNLSVSSSSFDYLKDEEDLYTVKDLKEKYK